VLSDVVQHLFCLVHTESCTEKLEKELGVQLSSAAWGNGTNDSTGSSVSHTLLLAAGFFLHTHLLPALALISVARCQFVYLN